MPIYEYQCSQCKERQEIIQRISEAPLAHCPQCGGEMKKLISSPAIQFKGSGFYKTDYPSASSKQSSSDSKSESKGESKGDTKSETKSEAKSEAKTESKSETKAAE
ncbi:MAG TPA: FmdB family zinc ribbon protein [Thermoanaerobaculia bacterium]|jgi:putative FmdB family regulatory protein|nr:FmdB family zinc ribbon protein [Thermoanaerobaculia bacterium]